MLYEVPSKSEDYIEFLERKNINILKDKEELRIKLDFMKKIEFFKGKDR